MKGIVLRTLFDKIWDANVVEQYDDGVCLLYVDRHLLDEIHSPQAFEGLRRAGLPVRRPEAGVNCRLTGRQADSCCPPAKCLWKIRIFGTLAGYR